MRESVALLVLVLLPAVRGQETDVEPVRVSIAHLFDTDGPSLAPPLWPTEEAPGLLALGPTRTERFDPRLLDLVSYQGKRRFGLDRGLRIERDATDLVVYGGGVADEDVRGLVLDLLEAYAPAIDLDIGVWPAGPGPVPIVLPAGELQRHLAGEALYSRQVARAGGHVVSVDLRGTDGERAMVRIEPHLLSESRSVALLCEFAIDRRTRDGSRHWTAGTASAVVATGAALAISLPDRVLVVRANHEARQFGQLAGVPWSLLGTTGLRYEPSLGDGPDLLQLRPVETRLAGEVDLLRRHMTERVWPGKWDSRGSPLTSDFGPRGLLISGSTEDLQEAIPLARSVFGELEVPMSSNARLDCLLPVAPEPAVPGVVRLPALPGRLACVLHAACPPDGGEPRGALVALTWAVDRESRPPAASGFATRLRGAELRELDGQPQSFRRRVLDRRGHAELVRTSEMVVEIAERR